MNKWEIDQGNDFFDPTNLEIVTIDVGNKVSNVIPMNATAKFNIRFNSEQNADGLTKIITNICNTHSENHTLDINVSGDSFLTPKGDLSELIEQGIKEITGKTVKFSTTGGTSDARFIKNYCPVIEFGLINKTIHKVNECVKVSDIILLKDIYLSIIRKFFSS